MIQSFMTGTDINYNAYNSKADIYIEKNVGGTTGGYTPEKRVSNFKKHLDKGRVLEIGSGAGLDALVLKQADYDVTASDFVQSFRELLSDKGLNVINLNAKLDAIPSSILPLDGVYANAVFVHFNEADFRFALKNIHAALQSGGVLFFSVMLGEGTEISGRAKGIEREFFYYNEDSIRKILSEVGLEVLFLEYPIDGKWFHTFCHKP
jgi:SAM-dependent methyltransferase